MEVFGCIVIPTVEKDVETYPEGLSYTVQKRVMLPETRFDEPTKSFVEQWEESDVLTGFRCQRDAVLFARDWKELDKPPAMPVYPEKPADEQTTEVKPSDEAPPILQNESSSQAPGETATKTADNAGDTASDAKVNETLDPTTETAAEAK